MTRQITPRVLGEMNNMARKSLEVVTLYDYGKSETTKTLSDPRALPRFFEADKNHVLIKSEAELRDYPFCVRVFDRDEGLFESDAEADSSYLVRFYGQGRRSEPKLFAFGQMAQYNHTASDVKREAQSFGGLAQSVNHIFNRGIKIKDGLVYGIPKWAPLQELFGRFDIYFDDYQVPGSCGFLQEWNLIYAARQAKIKLVGDKFTREFLDLERTIKRRHIHGYLTELIENVCEPYTLPSERLIEEGSRIDRLRTILPTLRGFMHSYEAKKRMTFAKMAKKEPIGYLTLVEVIAELMHAIGIEPPAKQR